MAKNSYVYFCSECGYESSKWMGQCPGCKAWNSFIEEKVSASGKGKSTKTGSYRDAEKSPYTLSEISTEEEERLQIGINELENVMEANKEIVSSISTLSAASEEVLAGTQVSKGTIDSTFDSMKAFSETVDGTFDQLQILKETAVVE